MPISEVYKEEVKPHRFFDRIDLFNEHNESLLPKLKDESIDIICIDPPYLYLYGQKLERPFNEIIFFTECARVLSNDGFIVLFGRGESFYRWNHLLSEIIKDCNGNYGFKVYDHNTGDVINRLPFKSVFSFKEEIIWDKGYCSSPLLAISRVHETVSLWTKGNGIINRTKVPYGEMKFNDPRGLKSDIKRLKVILNNPKSLDSVLSFLETGEIKHQSDKPHKHNVSAQISGLKTPDRSMAVIQSMQNGMNEKSIIKTVRDHYDTIHPTQKPTRLIERLLNLVIPNDKPKDRIVVADFFGGSFSCMEAVFNLGMCGLSTEIDEEYFTSGLNRIKSLQTAQLQLFKSA